MKMKKAAWSMLLCIPFLLCGCGSAESESTAAETSEQAVTSETETVFSKGRFLSCKGGRYIVILEDHGACTINLDNETAEKFTDGDIIQIEYDGDIAESYPAQITSVQGAELIEDGELSDIDESVLADLREMGWID